MKKMIVPIFIFITFSSEITFALSGDIFPRPLVGCAILGYNNSTLNKCGYCVGPETGLPLDYGEDCSGKCLGGAQADCEGVCNGNAFRDECSGRCISGKLNPSVNFGYFKLFLYCSKQRSRTVANIIE